MATRSEVPGAWVMVALVLLITVWASAFVGDSRGEAPAGLSGDLRAEHIAMIEQMRRGVSPEMVERMDAREWRWMRDPAHLPAIEAHIRESDRMLGRTSARR